MVQNGQITLYKLPISHYAYRVVLALEEAGATYTSYDVDIHGNYAWFKAIVNPAGQVPALTYGGPKTAPGEPSPESAKVAESLVILEFIADLFPERGLMPADPVGRARVRSFIAFFETTFIRDSWNPVFHEGESPTKLVGVLEVLQSRLPETGYVVGEWSIADAAAAPFLALLPILLEHEIGKYPLGQGTLALAAINDPRLARVRRYIADLKNRASFKKVWDEDVQLLGWKNYPRAQRT
ncbi:thioredoxin-like protein [Earliella scabrosa]|nr:thioredoxin-like protein [Earliella scabrosa]